MKQFRTCLLTIIGTAVLSASPLVIGPGGGALNLTATSVQVTGTSSSGCINFYNTVAPDACDGANNPLMTIAPIDTVLFADNSAGSIKDIINSAPTTGFLTITGGSGGQGTVHFDLLDFVIPNPAPCNFAPNPATPFVCDLPNSPFTFTGNAPGSITVSFVIDMCAYTGASGGVGCNNGTLYSGTFSSQFQNTFNGGTPVTLSNLISAEQSPSGITDSVSATLAPSAPEPGTLALCGLGLIGVGMLRRRRAE